jgi:hypothetical protein
VKYVTNKECWSNTQFLYTFFWEILGVKRNSGSNRSLRNSCYFTRSLSVCFRTKFETDETAGDWQSPYWNEFWASESFQKAVGFSEWCTFTGQHKKGGGGGGTRIVPRAGFDDAIPHYDHPSFARLPWLGREKLEANNGKILYCYLLTYLLRGAEYYLKSCLSKNPAFVMELEGSLPCLQKPASGPCRESAESSSPHGSVYP